MYEEEDWDAEVEGKAPATAAAKPNYDAWNNAHTQSAPVFDSQRSPPKSVNNFSRSRGRGQWSAGRSDRSDWRRQDDDEGQSNGFSGFSRGNRGRGRDEGRRGGRGGSFGGGFSSRNDSSEGLCSGADDENKSTMYVESSSVGRIIGKYIGICIVRLNKCELIRIKLGL